MRPILCVILLTPFVAAQREEADVEWQKHHAKIEYGVVNLGQHKLDALQAGSTWRMGRNEASHLKTDMALLVGDQVVVPGSYRVNVARNGEKDFSLGIDGGSLGDAPQGSPAAVYVKGDLGKTDKAAKKLEVGFKPEAKSTTAVQKAKVTVSFGEHQLVAGLALVGTNTKKAGGWTLDAFTLPADLVEKRLAENKAIPLATLKKETGDKKKPFHAWNLVVTKDGAELWPAPEAPADSNGFGEVKSLSSSSMVKASSVKWEESKDSKPFLELTKFEAAKGKGSTIVVAVGKQTCTIVVGEPKVPE
jgi:hypothetical protein